MPPHDIVLYRIMLIENSDDAVVEIDGERYRDHRASLFFGAPGHISAWVRGQAQRGYVVYLAEEFLSHHPRALLEEFSFFRPTEINAVPVTESERTRLRDHLGQLLRTFRARRPYRVQMLQSLAVALLFECRGIFEAYSLSAQPKDSRTTLAFRFQNLLEERYLITQTVQEYAELLHVTPNHLSAAVSSALGRTAHKLISDRLALEARKLLRYTDLGIAEVADYLGFAEPTHFARFFKRQLRITPLEYRRSGET